MKTRVIETLIFYFGTLSITIVGILVVVGALKLLSWIGVPYPFDGIIVFGFLFLVAMPIGFVFLFEYTSDGK